MLSTYSVKELITSDVKGSEILRNHMFAFYVLRKHFRHIVSSMYRTIPFEMLAKCLLVWFYGISTFNGYLTRIMFAFLSLWLSSSLGFLIVWYKVIWRCLSCLLFSVSGFSFDVRESGKRSRICVMISLSNFTLVSKYHISISPQFSTLGSLVKGHLEVTYYLRFYLLHWKCRIISGFLSMSTISSLAQIDVVYFLLSSGLCWSPMRNENYCLYAFSLYRSVVVGGSIELINFLLLWI